MHEIFTFLHAQQPEAAKSIQSLNTESIPSPLEISTSVQPTDNFSLKGTANQPVSVGTRSYALLPSKTVTIYNPQQIKNNKTCHEQDSASSNESGDESCSETETGSTDKDSSEYTTNSESGNSDGEDDSEEEKEDLEGVEQEEEDDDANYASANESQANSPERLETKIKSVERELTRQDITETTIKEYKTEINIQVLPEEKQPLKLSDHVILPEQSYLSKDSNIHDPKLSPKGREHSSLYKSVDQLSSTPFNTFPLSSLSKQNKSESIATLPRVGRSVRFEEIPSVKKIAEHSTSKAPKAAVSSALSKSLSSLNSPPGEHKFRTSITEIPSPSRVEYTNIQPTHMQSSICQSSKTNLPDAAPLTQVNLSQTPYRISSQVHQLPVNTPHLFHGQAPIVPIISNGIAYIPVQMAGHGVSTYFPPNSFPVNLPTSPKSIRDGNSCQQNYDGFSFSPGTPVMPLPSYGAFAAQSSGYPAGFQGPQASNQSQYFFPSQPVPNKKEEENPPSNMNKATEFLSKDTRSSLSSLKANYMADSSPSSTITATSIPMASSVNSIAQSSSRVPDNFLQSSATPSPVARNSTCQNLQTDQPSTTRLASHDITSNSQNMSTENAKVRDKSYAYTNTKFSNVSECLNKPSNKADHEEKPTYKSVYQLTPGGRSTDSSSFLGNNSLSDKPKAEYEDKKCISTETLPTTKSIDQTSYSKSSYSLSSKLLESTETISCRKSWAPSSSNLTRDEIKSEDIKKEYETSSERKVDQYNMRNLDEASARLAFLNKSLENLKETATETFHSSKKVIGAQPLMREDVKTPTPSPPPVNFSTLPKHTPSSSPSWMEVFEATPPLLVGYNLQRSAFTPLQSGQPASAIAATATTNTTPTTTAPTTTSTTTNPSTTVSDKRKFFEKAMEESTHPSPKPERVFAFLSQDEVEKMKQEEDKKIATLTKSEWETWSHESKEEEFAMDIDSDKRSCASPTDTLCSMGSVRTAKAERRLKERLMHEGLLSDDEDSDLTPAEQRALRAEKRAAWRQARLKSLEQDALQAQMVIKKMSEMIGGRTVEEPAENNNRPETDHQNNVSECLRPSSDDFPKLAVRHSPGPVRVRESERVVGETVTTKTEEYVDEETGLIQVRTVEIVEKLIEKEVETTREKIISLELSTGEVEGEGDDEGREESDLTPTSPQPPTTTTPTHVEDGTTKRRRRKKSKKGH